MRSSRVYRRYWYAKKRRGGSMRFFTILLSVIIILSLLAAYAQKKVLPYIMDVSEMKTRSVITHSVESVIKDEFGSNLSYGDIVIVERDSMNRIISIQTDVNRLNILSAKIVGKIQEKLLYGAKEEIGVPLGTILGNAIFSAEGPDIYVKFISVGQVETNFQSSFTNMGEEQMRHCVNMEVKVSMRIAAPMIKTQREIMVEVPLAETVIMSISNFKLKS